MPSVGQVCRTLTDQSAVCRCYDPELGRFLNADALVSTGQGLLGNNMFAYCRNNPVCRFDTGGAADMDAFDADGNPATEERDFWGKQSGGSTSGTVSGGGNSGLQGNGQANGSANGSVTGYGFASESALNQHYADHNGDFGNAFSSPQEYLDTANYVIQNGEYVSAQNAYVKFYGLHGHANFAFVGMNRAHTCITTFHLKHVSKICFD